jgi:probable phosphoglycerate mutase
VFSHGAAIRVHTAFAARLPTEKALELRIMNTGMSILDGDPDQGWTLTQWHPEPLGGLQLDDSRARDITGDAADDVA